MFPDAPLNRNLHYSNVTSQRDDKATLKVFSKRKANKSGSEPFGKNARTTGSARIQPTRKALSMANDCFGLGPYRTVYKCLLPKKKASCDFKENLGSALNTIGSTGIFKEIGEPSVMSNMVSELKPAHSKETAKDPESSAFLKAECSDGCGKRENIFCSIQCSQCAQFHEFSEVLTIYYTITIITPID